MIISFNNEPQKGGRDKNERERTSLPLCNNNNLAWDVYDAGLNTAFNRAFYCFTYFFDLFVFFFFSVIYIEF